MAPSTTRWRRSQTGTGESRTRGAMPFTPARSGGARIWAGQCFLLHTWSSEPWVCRSSFVMNNGNTVSTKWDAISIACAATDGSAGFARCKKALRSSRVLCISSQCKHPKESWEFVRFATGMEGQKLLGKNCIPVLKEAAYKNFCTPPPKNIRVFVDQMTSGEVVISPVEKKIWYGEFRQQVFYPEIDKLFLGQQTIDQTLKRIKEAGDKFIKKN